MAGSRVDAHHHVWRLRSPHRPGAPERPAAAAGLPRARPHGWLDDRDDLGIDAGAEIGISGG